jgi:predicted MFS family arabinose efflux permease
LSGRALSVRQSVHRCFFTITTEMQTNTSSSLDQQYLEPKKQQQYDDRDINDPIPSEKKPSYWSLIQNNPQFRLFLISHLSSLLGEWLTYIAIITMIEEWLPDGESSRRTRISYLVVIRLFPYVFLSAVGGALADSYDRRKATIVLNLISSFVTLLNLLVWRSRSILLVYLVTFLQHMICALYEPCSSALIPLLISNQEELKLATTIMALAWSLMAAVGAFTGGLVVIWLGCRTCFLLDSLTFIISAWCMYQVKGNFCVLETTQSYTSPWSQIICMTRDGYIYLGGQIWGSLVLMKASSALIYGASDVLNVSFSERNDDSSLVPEVKLGILFAMTGAGCILGPLLSDCYTSMSDYKSLQVSFLVCLLAQSTGCLGVGFLPGFHSTCFFSLIRSAGSNASWTTSSVLLQSLSAPGQLGRVLAVDYALALATEACSALLAGILQDYVKFTAEQVSLVMAGIGISLFSCWTVYHCLGFGAAHPLLKDHNQQEMNDSSIEERFECMEDTPLLILKK